jgi:hypothetical protein
MRILDFVDRLYVISLPSKEDRRRQLVSHLSELGLANETDITWVRAIYGEVCPAPGWFHAGGAAWGCLQSHLRIVQDALMDGIDSYCVLEDDAVFNSRAPHMFKRLLRELPSDWGQLYLGGQHLEDPVAMPERPYMWRCRNINRTHAFMLHRRAFAKFQQHIMNAPDYIAKGPWHIDHQLGLAHERWDWPTYAPRWWLAGQDAGCSNISGKSIPRTWWHHQMYRTELPFVYVDADTSPELIAAMEGYVHFGNYLKQDSRQDVGLDVCVESTSALDDWLAMIAGEAVNIGRLPGIQHSGIPISRVREQWRAGAIPASEADVRSLCDYPFNGLFPHVASRTSLTVMAPSAA